MTENEKLYTTLLVIGLGGTFSNAYGLCRFLARKFEIFECTEIINGIVNNNFVTYHEEDGVKQFFVSEKGHEILKQNRLRMIETLKMNFPNELVFIEKF